MILDNLFATMGPLTTAAALLGVLAILGTPAVGSLICPRHALIRRLQPRGR
jgi:hypothetical protein